MAGKISRFWVAKNTKYHMLANLDVAFIDYPGLGRVEYHGSNPIDGLCDTIKAIVESVGCECEISD